MNNHPRIFVLLLVILLTACGNGLVPPTASPTSTSTPSPAPTATGTPTNTPSPIPPTTIEGENMIAPRWMIVGQPGSSVRILGEKWNYSGDNWGAEYACIDYTRDSGQDMSFEQCFALSNPEQNFESILARFTDNGFKTLQPRTQFEGVEQISLVAKTEAENKNHYFEILQAQDYVLLVEMNHVTKETGSLQGLYEKHSADIIDYVLQDSLQKAHLIPSPTPTPMAAAQQEFYEVLSPLLVTLPQANSIYGGTWDVVGDRASTKRTQVCRDFEDRTNADVLWVGFMNCVYSVKDLPFEKIASYYQNEGDVVLESKHTYEGQFVLYAYQDGHTFFDAYLQSGDYVFLVGLESRTMAGQKPAEVFSQDVDDYIYGVLMENIKK